MMPWLLNTAWMVACAREAWAFGRAMGSVEAAQARVLGEIVAANRETEIGRRLGFGGIGSAAAYQERVPLSGYADYAAAVERIGRGEDGVLTHQRVALLEPTSGSTGGEKLVPYTADLRGQFQRAVAAWMYDLLRRRPGLRGGRAYWSISPAVGGSRRTAGGVAVGFEEDAEYLGRASRWMVRRLLAVPGEVARVRELGAFRRATLRHLVMAEDLALVSVWSPTFLLALMEALEEGAEALAAEVDGCGRRGRAVAAILRERGALAEKVGRLWPRLRLISCWADAGAARYVGAVRGLFPGVEIQAKGLLATEGCVSFPLVDAAAPVLAVRSHFFEFQETGGAERVRLAHEVEAGGRYAVILTTGGGLYRYGLRDEVEVVGRHRGCPMVRFLGKIDGTSDLVGEKLGEAHVRGVLDGVLAARGVGAGFALLTPAAGGRHYVLYVQARGLTWAMAGGVAAALDAGLSGNPYYRYAREVGQLGMPEVVVLDAAGAGAWGLYERRCVELGQRAGDIKPVALDRRGGWEDVFACVVAEGGGRGGVWAGAGR